MFQPRVHPFARPRLPNLSIFPRRTRSSPRWWTRRV